MLVNCDLVDNFICTRIDQIINLILQLNVVWGWKLKIRLLQLVHVSRLWLEVFCGQIAVRKVLRRRQSRFRQSKKVRLHFVKINWLLLLVFIVGCLLLVACCWLLVASCYVLVAVC